MTRRILAALMGAVLLLSACASSKTPPVEQSRVSSAILNVERVENMPEDFILGMDASCVPALEKGGVRYYDHEGAERDVYAILSENGINYIRVRVWNDPFTADGRGYGGGNCDIENAVEIGRRATQYGMKLLVDFHYSDFWADPGKQMVPKAWAGMGIEEKCDALYDYTRLSLEKLLEAGVNVGMVQIGNETNGGLCGENSWENIASLMNSGAKAVRESCPDALVAVHFTNPEKPGSYEFYGEKLAEYAVDYDVFASSYYPFWHGSFENLAAVLSGIAENYGKKVMVAECSYPFTGSDSDFYPNTLWEGSERVNGYEFSEQGQADFVRDTVDTLVNGTANGIGLIYWEGTWISSGGDSREENSALWEEYGSGWASSHAAEYDSEDAGKWYGGCAVDNQAFFRADGHATEALKVFALMKEGNVINNGEDS